MSITRFEIQTADSVVMTDDPLFLVDVDRDVTLSPNEDKRLFLSISH